MGYFLKPRYESDSDYTTNAPSYYDDLARKNKLIKILSKRIYDYDEELAKRFEAWDKNLEDFDEEVIKLLVKWLEDGTLAKIINEEIFGWLKSRVTISIDTMKAYDYQPYDYVKTLGYYDINDGGHAEYIILDTNETADNGYIIQLDNGLQAHLLYGDDVNVKWFGAKGNAQYRNSAGDLFADQSLNIPAHDDTHAFNLATMYNKEHTGGNSTPLKRSIIVPDGDYAINGTVYVRKGQHLTGSTLGGSRVRIPSKSSNISYSFKLGFGFVGGQLVEDSGGLPPTITNLATDGGYLNAPVIDGSGVAGMSLNDLFMTSYGIALKSPSGDLNANNITFDIGQTAIQLAGSRNSFVGCSFFNNATDINIIGNTYDTIFSDVNLAYATYVNISVNDHDVKKLSFNNCNFIGNAQYENFLGGLLLNAVKNAGITFNGCKFANLKGYASRHINGAYNNNIVFNACEFDGEKTHPTYVQGTTSNAILVGNNNIKVYNSRFNNLRGTKPISLDQTLGKLLLQGCSWNNNMNSEQLVSIDNNGNKIQLFDNIGDNVTPLINLHQTTSPEFKGNKNWLGGIKQENGKKFLKIPTYGGSFIAELTISANTNNASASSYRKAVIANVYRYTDYDSTSVQNYVGFDIVSEPTNSVYSPNIEFQVVFDNIEGTNKSNHMNSRYIIVSVPDSYQYLKMDITIK